MVPPRCVQRDDCKGWIRSMASKAIVQKTQVTFPSIYPDVNAVNPVTVGRFCVTQASHEFPVQKKKSRESFTLPVGAKSASRRRTREARSRQNRRPRQLAWQAANQ